MRIAVNTRLLLKNKLEGIGWFAFETLRRITQAHPEHEFIFIFDRPYHKDFIFSDNITPVVVPPQSRHPILWYLFFQFSVKRILIKYKADVYLSPEGYMPLGCPCAAIIVMHDIAYEHYPESVSFLVGKYYRYFFPRFAGEAKVVATVSEYSKNDLVANYHIPPEKIKNISNGYNEKLHSVDEKEKQLIKNKFTSGEDYYVFVGGLYPRKNIARLINAFEKYKEKTSSDYKLVLVGKHVYGTELLTAQKQKSKYSDDIIFTGRVDEFSDFNGLIASTAAMVYPSVFEGFGIPCLEAMQCGVPVITSDTSSMPEVCGNAAYYINPYSTESLADALEKISTDNNLRNDLIAKGNERLKNFSWDRTAELLWEEVLSLGRIFINNRR